jgi:hypothetical protein
MGGSWKAKGVAFAGALFLLGAGDAGAQVVAEPALLTAGVPARDTFLPYVTFPENAVVLGGMIRFAVTDDVDIGGRAGLWLVENADDTPFAGADVRYALLARRLSPGGGQLALSFDVGLGVSEPDVTVWKIPVGLITGIGFRLAGGDSEVFVHPRIELGVSSGRDDFDSALLLDLGGLFSVTPGMGVLIDLRFGDGVFGEGDAVVVGLGALWRL